jgi:hypothetical protein
MTTHPAVRVGRTITTGLGPTLGIFIAVVAAIFIVVGAATAMFGDVEASVWQTAGAGAFKYFPLAIAIMLTPVFLPIYVAQGVTRRQFAVGGALFIAAWAAILTMAVVAGYGVEAAVYRANGWPHEFDTPHLFESWTQVHLVVAEYVMLIAAHMVAGWVIGTSYYVLGWFRATLLLPVTAAPALVVEALLATSWAGAGLREFTTYTPPLVGIAVSGAVVVIGAAWAVNYGLTRSLPIKLKNA